MSTTAWDVLGIAETDDARAIKRAYAARLKTTRPDEDATAFQQLSDAYEWATMHARHLLRERESALQEAAPCHGVATERTAGSAADDVDALPELGRPIQEPVAADTAPDALPESSTAQSFDFGQFFSELCEPLRKQDPIHLKAWLEANEALYSIELKWALMPHVFDALARQGAELDPHRGHVEVLQTFFGVDARLRRHPAIAPALDYLEARAWLDASAVPGMRARSPQEAFDALVDKQLSKRVKPVERMLMRELIGPIAWLRRLVILLVPGLPGRLADLFGRLAATCADSAYTRLDAEALEFWRRVTDRDGFDWRRLVLPLARAPMLVIPIMAFVNLLVGQDRLLSGAPTVVAVAAGLSLTCTVGITALRRLVAWNQATLQWHLPLVVVAILFCAAIALALAGSGWWTACAIGVVMLWNHPRNLGATLFAVTGAALTWGLLFDLLQQWPAASGSEWALVVSVLLTVAMLVVIDLVTARVRRVAIDTARTSFTTPAWMIGAGIAVTMAAETTRGLL